MNERTTPGQTTPPFPEHQHPRKCNSGGRKFRGGNALILRKALDARSVRPSSKHAGGHRPKKQRNQKAR